MKTCSKELDRSLLGITKHPEWANMIQERLLSHEVMGVSVRGISHTKFLLTFQEKEDRDECNMQALLNIFMSVRSVNNLDLIVPQIAWVWCEGLPIVAWNKETWQKIVGDWRYLLTKNQKPLRNAMFQELQLCISTHRVDLIDETLKVMIEERGFWVKMKEFSPPAQPCNSFNPEMVSTEDLPPSSPLSHSSPVTP